MEEYVPDVYKKNVHDINYKKLKKQGIKCLLFDLDNTLAHPRISFKAKRKPTPKVKKLFKELEKMGFKIIVFSNGLKQNVLGYSNQLKVDSIYQAKKPKSKNFEKVMKDNKLKETQMAMIGDQLLTDIKGGNLMNMTTILVRPFTKKEFIFTKFNRLAEKRVIKKLSKKDMFRVGKYYE